MRLNEIEREYTELQEMLSTVTEDDDKQVFMDTLESIRFDAEDKLIGYGRVIENLKADVDALKAKEKRMALRRKTIETNIEWLKSKVIDAMKLMELKKLDDGDIIISIAKNGGKAPVLLTEAYKADPTLLPFNFQRTKVEADMDAIRDALEAGEELDFAIIGERGESLRIK